jgi:hypothetical protein
VDCEGNYLVGPTSENNIEEQAKKKVRIGTTMLAETEEPIKSENSVTKKTGPVWNLKGRLIEDILTDLEILKNDPDIPMPVIEADPASIEDFQQYTRNIPAVDTNEQLDDEQEEKLKDKDSLEYLSSISGNSHLELRPEAFPAELWPYVTNDQKLLVKARWEGYCEDTIHSEVQQLLKDLKVSEERKFAHPYFQAQALANVDRFLVKGREKVTPLIHEKYTHKMDLIPGTRPRKEAPQKFSETQKNTKV